MQSIKYNIPQTKLAPGSIARLAVSNALISNEMYVRFCTLRSNRTIALLTLRVKSYVTLIYKEDTRLLAIMIHKRYNLSLYGL